MPTFLLRNSATSRAYPNCFDVILTLEDGYELRAGGISETWGSSPAGFWAWSCIGANGREATRDAAMAALKAAWCASEEDLARERQEQEWTEDKYALWDAGYAQQIMRGEIHCPCGQTFNPRFHEQTRAHIGHITGRNR